MNHVYIYTYKRGSASGRLLAKSLGIRRIRHEDSRFRPAVGKLILNWGASELPPATRGLRVLNPPDAVARNTDKSVFLREANLGGLPVPALLEYEQAQEALRNRRPVVCRTILRGSQGAGVHVYSGPPDDLPREYEGKPVRIYVEYVKKIWEYRVHCARGIGVFDTQQKRRKREVVDRDNQVRNHHNGWVFCREDINGPPQEVLAAAQQVLDASGLDFGAVDVVWNQHHKRAAVLEINTAPGLEGRTLETYTDIIRRLIDEDTQN